MIEVIENNIVILLKAKGTTKRALADYLGIQETVVNRTIRNPRITLQTLTKIAKFFDCSLLYLLSGVSEKSFAEPLSASLGKSCPSCRDKERIISEKERTIRMLEDRINDFEDILDREGLRTKKAS
jgi:transcriptional regulator with XRE-family HTH domain